MTFFVQRQSVNDRFRELLGVLQPAPGYRGEVGVVIGEQLFRAGEIFCLHQPAIHAHQYSQRVAGFRRFYLVGSEIGIRRRCLTEIEKHVVQLRIAVAAIHSVLPVNLLNFNAIETVA